ncbi:hypothetical protein [Streptomyces gibsoniae]|uniref:Uncharacterized protein n=1 Tax=Streptomyces gibsoniae TaxID=3075529 RepID=A0ABU2TWL2_9ACTN|nr:hypothetical protein [Streptomyces sp. DSM 41699]MDT0465344.1 hypothetical protein [Streptomyces sp. DSM 41699]
MIEKPAIVVYPPAEDGGRRVRVGARFVGMAYSLLDVAEFLEEAGRGGCFQGKPIRVDLPPKARSEVSRRRLSAVGGCGAELSGEPGASGIGVSACQFCRILGEDARRAQPGDTRYTPGEPMLILYLGAEPPNDLTPSPLCD